MEDVPISWEDTVDPSGCNSSPDVYQERSRDPVRTPFPWDDTKNAGFSTANKTWLPVGEAYKMNNVKAQEAAENSHLKIFRKLTKLRREAVWRKGDYKGAVSNNNNVYSFVRRNEKEVGVVVLNFGKQNADVNLNSLFADLPDTLRVKVSSLQSGMNDG